MKKRLMCLLLVFAVVLSSCGRNEVSEADPEDGIYSVIYENAAYSTVTNLVTIDAATKEETAEKLFEALKEPDDETSGFSVIPEEMELLYAVVEQDVLTVYFDSSYADMDKSAEVLCRMALVRTFTQIPDISYVSIYVANQPLLDENGNPYGNLSASDFVSVVGTDFTAMEEETLSLYFPNAAGDALILCDVSFSYSNTASVEEYVVDFLLAGPEDTDTYAPAFPDGTSLLGIGVRDSVCYVNLSFDNADSNVTANPEVSIYALVNSLTALSSVSQVQIMIGGSSDTDYNGVPLQEAFFANLDYIGETEETED